jgi:hypothetical protein
MEINYKFNSDIEPTDEQLQFLMSEVTIEVKKKAQKSNELFFEQLQKLAYKSLQNRANIKTENQ